MLNHLLGKQLQCNYDQRIAKESRARRSRSITERVWVEFSIMVQVNRAKWTKLRQVRLNSYIIQCWNWPKRTGGSAAEMCEILPRDWSLWPIFTQKWASV